MFKVVCIFSMWLVLAMLALTGFIAIALVARMFEISLINPLLQPTINFLVNLAKQGDAKAGGTKKKKKLQLLQRPIICICNDL